MSLFIAYLRRLGCFYDQRFQLAKVILNHPKESYSFKRSVNNTLPFMEVLKMNHPKGFYGENINQLFWTAVCQREVVYGMDQSRKINSSTMNTEGATQAEKELQEVFQKLEIDNQSELAKGFKEAFNPYQIINPCELEQLLERDYQSVVEKPVDFAEELYFPRVALNDIPVPDNLFASEVVGMDIQNASSLNNLVKSRVY
jgi:hypothetical protein